MSRAFVIAEAGVNHNGSLDLARRLVDAAAVAGADAVKFQTFRADALVTTAAPKAHYQIAATGADQSQHDMLKALELDADAHQALLTHCRERGLEFLSTPFDEGSLAFLVDGLGVARLKIGSGDLTNAPLLLAAARTGLPLILSTGMADLDEVSAALGVVAYGLSGGRQPGRAAFATALGDGQLRARLAGRVTLLQCTTEYPAPAETINLRAMATLARTFAVPVGLSDHSEGTPVALAAAALGASVVEKHLTLNRTLHGPDHLASLEPADFARMVAGIRTVEAALGDGRKRPHPLEQANALVARKSLAAARDIAAGETFTAENVIALRPGDGLSPLGFWDLLGSVALRAYRRHETIRG